MLAADPVISEFMAINASTLADEDGDFSDWIEVLNAGDESLSLDGYWLTDRNNELTGWRFPDVELAAGEAIVVFASGKDRDVPDSELHTDFRLDGDGDYLALVGPDGSTIVQEFAPQYPPQAADVAYGIAPEVMFSTLVEADSTVSYFVPTDNSIQETWALEEFDEAAWPQGTMGIGYETLATEDDPVVASTLGLEPVGYWRFEETSRSQLTAASLGSDPALAGTYEGRAAVSLDGPDGFGFEQPHSAVRFDGRNDAVTTDVSPLSGLSQFSMMGFISPDEQTENRVGLFGQNDAVEFGFISPNRLQVWTPDGGNLTVDYNFPNDEWHHVAVVGNGTDLRIYIDGDLAGTGGTATASYGSSGEAFNIGGDGIFDGEGNWFDGEMDEVAIFDRALTATQINDVINGTGSDPNAANLTSLISTDVQATMLNQNSSLYVRAPFEVPDPSRLAELKLNLNYDDGFVAYLNGLEVARANAPGEEDDPVAYDATATFTPSDVNAINGVTIDISDSRDALRVGRNVLGIQLLNASADDPDAVIRAELTESTASVDATVQGYLTTPSPGDGNNPVTTSLGPMVSGMSHTPNDPTSDQPITVSVQVTETLHDVAGVELKYRVMFRPETTISMFDDGNGPDAVAGDGIYTATIPGNIAQPGEMVRWYAEATDVTATEGRWPRFEVTSGRDRTPEYEGTLIVDPTIESQLGVLHWFVEDEAAAGGSGTHASLSFNGEFYDSVFVRQRGGSTRNNSLGKTNFKFDFVQEQFRFDEDHPRVEEFNLNTTATDKSYLRQSLSFETYAAMGGASSISFPMNIQRNGEFYGVFVFIEEPDDEMLERNGLDDNGALYKNYTQLNSVNARKKTREDENNQDLRDLVSAVNSLEGEELRNYLIDNVDLPATMNYLVATVLVHQNDNPHKNHFLYRDTEGSGEWTFLPWDNDLTFGSNWVGTSFSDIIYADDDVITEGPVPGHDPAFIHPSHPFVNAEPYREWNNHWNRLMDPLLQDPILQQMYLRRLRSGMDMLMGEPGTRDSFLDQRLDDYLAIMVPDAAADKEVWWQRGWGTDQTFAEAVEIIREDYLEVRRQHLYVTHSVDNLGADEIEVLLPEGSNATYFVPGNDDLQETWTTIDFDDADWGSGPLGIGFENSPRDFIDLIQTRVKPTEVVEDSTSIFVRVPFTIDDPAAIEQLSLRMKYDDGFAAFINGEKVLEQNLDESGFQSWNSEAGNHSDARAQNFENFNISQFVGLLQPGENILAIHGMNSSVSSSDMLISPELIDGVIQDVQIAGIPHAQAGNPAIAIDQADYDVNPISGNQDEEYLKLNNPTDDYVDISGWRLEGGVEHTFAPGTIIPAGNSLFVSPDVAAFRARATGPSGGQGLFVQGGYAGHLSSFGETVTLIAADGQVMSSVTTPSNPSSPQEFLRVTEVNYNPAGLDDATEFVELTNTNADGILDVSNVILSRGPQLPFSLPADTMLNPLQLLVITKDPAAFAAAYPEVPASSIFGPYVGNLSNQGERIKVDDAQGNTIVDFSYSDNTLWPSAADGIGSTLELKAIGTPTDQLGKFYQWQASRSFGGSPAAANSEAVGVVINEVLNNPLAGAASAVELYNSTGAEIDLQGWWLSDDADNLAKFQLPAGSTIGAQSYLSIDPTALGMTLGTDGDVWLSSATEFGDHVAYNEIARGESWGRMPNGSGRLTTLPTSTIGRDNGEPRVGPLVISEVNYNPGEPSEAATQIYAELDSNDLEFVELTNPTAGLVSLTSWRLRGGIDYDFDAGVVLSPGTSLLAIRFNPQNVENADRLAAFRTHYGLAEDVQIVGGFDGGLGNSLDRVTLRRPGANGQSYLEDEVIYDDVSPWPTSADGEGDTLQRVSSDAFGNVANSWIAAAATPGSAFGDLRGDFNDDGQVDVVDIDLLFAQIASAAPDLRFDLTGDNAVNDDDRDEMIENIVRIPYGDANTDGEFNSRDLVDIFAAGEYEDGIDGNSTWSEGDWDADGDFTTTDLVLALQKGGYRP